MPLARAQKRRSRGLTLVEVLIAATIVAVVAAIAWAALGARVKGSAKQQQVKSDLRAVAAAVNLYRGDHDDRLPIRWRDFGYFRVNRKDEFGKGNPPQDFVYDTPPTYDVSYHTPQCAAPPRSSMNFLMWSHVLKRHDAALRLEPMDLEHDHAARVEPVCDVRSYGVQVIRFRQRGVVKTRKSLPAYKSIGVSLSGSLSYQWVPNWMFEILLGS